MSLFDAMRTGVSGMNAQSSRISSVAENIANSSTTGYKRSSVEFETILVDGTTREYRSGGVAPHSRYHLSQQGSIQVTSDVTDLAIQGNGFFVVTNTSGAQLLTRAGSFVPDDQGRLVNTGGYYLMGYDMTTGAPTNGSADLTVVQLNQAALVANPTTFGRFAANLPSQANVVAAADLPSANAATAKYTAKSSLVAYDNLGAPVTLDVYMTKTGPNTWEAAVYNRADAATGGGFPYASASLTTSTLAFSATDGKLTSPPSLTVAVPGGQSTTIDISKTTQLAASYSVADQTLNGNAPSQIDRIEIGTDGTLATVYRDGTRIESFRIPLGNVVSPDRLTNLDGNAFAESLDSGGIVVGLANQANLGKIISSSLENSTVDLGNELTRMIEAQRGYTANSKVFQSSAELLDVLIKLPI